MMDINDQGWSTWAGLRLWMYARFIPLVALSLVEHSFYEINPKVNDSHHVVRYENVNWCDQKKNQKKIQFQVFISIRGDVLGTPMMILAY